MRRIVGRCCSTCFAAGQIDGLYFGDFCRFDARQLPGVYRRGNLRNVSLSSCGCLLGSFCGKNDRSIALGRGVSDDLFSRAFVIFRVSDVGNTPIGTTWVAVPLTEG